MLKPLFLFLLMIFLYLKSNNHKTLKQMTYLHVYTKYLRNIDIISLSYYSTNSLLNNLEFYHHI